MPSKVFEINDGLLVTIYKRKNSRHLRLSVSSDGKAKVSIPVWASYRAGLEFAKTRQDWIRDHLAKTRLLIDGQQIGKAHHLSLMESLSASKPTGRLRRTEVVVTYPHDMAWNSPEVQAIAKKACVRALRLQAEQLLPQRLANLAAKYGFEYGSMTTKLLKRRWGSCDQNRHIVLNLFLMQLPWELIDYVLLHELAHTVVLRHGTDFWSNMEKVLPNYKVLRRQLRGNQPQLS